MAITKQCLSVYFNSILRMLTAFLDILRLVLLSKYPLWQYKIDYITMYILQCNIPTTYIDTFDF